MSAPLGKFLYQSTRFQRLRQLGDIHINTLSNAFSESESIGAHALNPRSSMDYSEWGLPVRQFFLTDEQLWRAIAKNTTEVSNLMDQEVGPFAQNGADMRRARLIQFNNLQREYRVYAAELRRRYS